MGLLLPKATPPPPHPPLLSLYLKSAPDSQLCNSVNDGCRCCWSAQVTTGQKNESNRCLPTVRFIHWHGNILHRRRSGSRTDGYACLQLLGPSYFAFLLQDHGGVIFTACLQKKAELKIDNEKELLMCFWGCDMWAKQGFQLKAPAQTHWNVLPVWKFRYVFSP